MNEGSVGDKARARLAPTVRSRAPPAREGRFTHPAGTARPRKGWAVPAFLYGEIHMKSNGMDAPTRNGIDVPKWKSLINHLNRGERPL